MLRALISFINTDFTGSFSCINCWLDLGRFSELGVISATIWFSRKRVPKGITEYSEKQLFLVQQIFGRSCDLCDLSYPLAWHRSRGQCLYPYLVRQLTDFWHLAQRCITSVFLESSFKTVLDLSSLFFPFSIPPFFRAKRLPGGYCWCYCSGCC